MSIEFKGTDALIGALKEKATMDDVKNVVRMNGSEMQRKMQRNASFRGHKKNGKFIKPTGATKRSIQIEIKQSGMTAKVAPQTEYSPYLEYGTRFMDAQPFVRPAYQKQKSIFLNDMKRLME